MKKFFLFLMIVALILSCNNSEPGDPPKDPKDDTLQQQPQARPDTSSKEISGINGERFVYDSVRVKDDDGDEGDSITIYFFKPRPY